MGLRKHIHAQLLFALNVIKNKHNNNNKINHSGILIKHENNSIVTGVGRGYLLKVERAAAKLKHSFIRKNEKRILMFHASAIQHLYSLACTGVTA